MKKQILLLVLILITLSSICQEDYPQKVIIKRDTLVLITPSQVKLINLAFNDLDRYHVKSDSLYSITSLYSFRDNVSDSVISILKDQKFNLQGQMELCTSTVNILDAEVKKQKKIKKISIGFSLLLLILLIIK